MEWPKTKERFGRRGNYNGDGLSFQNILKDDEDGNETRRDEGVKGHEEYRPQIARSFVDFEGGGEAGAGLFDGRLDGDFIDFKENEGTLLPSSLHGEFVIGEERVKPCGGLES